MKKVAAAKLSNPEELVLTAHDTLLVNAVVQALDSKFTGIDGKFSVLTDRFDTLEEKVDVLGEKVDQLGSRVYFIEKTTLAIRDDIKGVTSVLQNHDIRISNLELA